MAFFEIQSICNILHINFLSYFGIFTTVNVFWQRILLSIIPCAKENMA